MITHLATFRHFPKQMRVILSVAKNLRARRDASAHSVQIYALKTAGLSMTEIDSFPHWHYNVTFY
jgi:hypothetical protein